MRQAKMTVSMNIWVVKSAANLKHKKAMLACRQVRDLPPGCTQTLTTHWTLSCQDLLCCPTPYALTSSLWTALPHNPCRYIGPGEDHDSRKNRRKPHQLEDKMSKQQYKSTSERAIMTQSRIHISEPTSPY